MGTNIIETYARWMEFSKIKYPLPVWILISFGFAILIAIGVFVIATLLINEVTLLPLAFGLAVLVLLIGYPYMKKESIVDGMEKNFSDALKQMADTLKAGDTYESALREVVEADYGRLSEEMEIALRRLEEGENIETALTGFAEGIDSRLIKRTITIVLDSIKTGASLAEILDEISDDVKDFQKLKDERKANTTMQFMFMIAAGGLIAPIIFGEINAVIGAFTKITTQALTPEQLAGAMQTSNTIVVLIQVYLIIEVIGSGAMMSLIREGKLNKSIIYIPLLLLMAFVMYYASSITIKLLLAGASL
jgi:flagellar protein FlaJ